MIEAALSDIGWPALALLLCAACLGAMVRGFAGFGTAMIFMPLASIVVAPVEALIMMAVFDAFGPLPMVPRALRDGEPKDVGPVKHRGGDRHSLRAGLADADEPRFL